MKPKILIVGDAVATTGFARVIRCVFEQLIDEYEIYQLGVSYMGDPHDYLWPLYPASSRGDLFGVSRINDLVHSIKPDLIFLLNDIWLVGDYLDALDGANLKSTPVIAYCPIEANGISASALSKLSNLKKLVLYTQFGKDEVAKIFLESGYDTDSLDEFLAVIPHGLDTEEFFPLSDTHDRTEIRRQLFGEASESFIVFNGNRNQPRKRIDTTIKGFSLFSQNKPDSVKLYLHMGITDLGWDVIELCKRFDVQDRLILTSNQPGLPSVSSEQLNLIYNACDVGVNTSSAEGWGLVSFEHAATKRPQIVPNHSSCAELWKGSGLLLEPKHSLISHGTLVEEKFVSADDLCVALETLYEDVDKRVELGNAAYVNATKPEYSWVNVAQQWRKLFNTIL